MTPCVPGTVFYWLDIKTAFQDASRARSLQGIFFLVLSALAFIAFFARFYDKWANSGKDEIGPAEAKSNEEGNTTAKAAGKEEMDKG